MAGTSIATAYIDLVPVVRDLSRDIERAMAPGQRMADQAGAAHGDAYTSSFGSHIKGLAAMAGGILTGMAASSVVKAGLDRLTTIQDATTSLNVILGDTTKTTALLDNIMKVVQGTPFSLAQFADAGKNLVAFGTSADKVPAYLKAIGDAAAASGQGTGAIDELVSAFGKMQASGKVSLEEVWSISDKGIPALQILANHFGVTTAAMQDMISSGSVPATEAMDALSQGIENGSTGIAGTTVAFAGTMQALGATFSGSLGNLKTAVARFGANLMKPWLDDMTGGMTTMSGILDTAGKTVGAWSLSLETTLKGAFETLKPEVEAAWSILTTGDFTAGAGAEDSPLVRALMLANDTGQRVKGTLEAAWATLTTGDTFGLTAEQNTPLTNALAAAHDKFLEVQPQIADAWHTLTSGDIATPGQPTPLENVMIGLRDWGLGVWGQFKGIWDTIWQIAQQLWTPLGQIATSLFDAYAAISASGWAPFKLLIDGLLTAFQWIADALSVTLVPALKWLGDFMTNNLPSVIGFVATISAFAAAVWLVEAATTAWAAIQAILDALLAANPIGLIVIAIAALVAGIIWAYNNVDWFKNGIQFLWDIIQNAWTWITDNAHLVSDAFGWIWDKLQPVFDFIGRGFAAIKEIIQGIIDFVVGVFTGDWAKAWDGIKEIFSGVWDWISNIIGGIWGILSGLGGQLLEWGGQLMGWILDGIKAGASAVWDWFTGLGATIWGYIITAKDALLGWGSELIGWIKDGIVNGAAAVWAWFTNLPDALWGTIQTVWASVVSWGQNLVANILVGITWAVIDIYNWFTALPGNLWAAIQAAWATVTSWGSSLFTWVWDGIQAVAAQVWDYILNWPANAWANIQAIWATVTTWGSSLFNWVWDGIKSIAVSVWQWFLDLPSTLWGFIVTAWQAVGQWGSDLFTWVWQGIQNVAVSVWQWFLDLPSTLWGYVVSAWQAVVSWGSSLITWIWQGTDGAGGIVGAFVAVKQWFLDLPSTLWTEVSAAWNKFTEWGAAIGKNIASGISSAKDGVLNAIKDLFSVSFDVAGAHVSMAYDGSINITTGAHGAVIPGIDTGKDNQIAAVRSGEAIMVPQFTKAVGGAPGVMSLNRMAEAGLLSFADGGVVNPRKPRSTLGGMVGAKTAAEAFRDSALARTGPLDVTGGEDITGRGGGWFGDVGYGVGNAIGGKVKTRIHDAVMSMLNMFQPGGAYYRGGSLVTGGINTSQNPPDYGWFYPPTLADMSWGGKGLTIAAGTQGLWSGMLDDLNANIQGGITDIGGYDDRQNVNNPSAKSLHAYGLAVDVNAPENPNGVTAYGRVGPGVIPSSLAPAIAKQYGMIWGGDFTGTPDGMHFEIHVSPGQIGAGGTVIAGAAGSGPIGGLSDEQASNARAIAGVAVARGLGSQGVLLGIVTALTESTLTNVAHGDAMGPSSRGLFQQMGPWGPLAVRMDPAGSAGLFYDALVRLSPPWNQQTPQMAAQHVEQSEFSDGSNYARNLDWARQITTSMGFDSGGWLQPGSMGINMRRQPEPILTPSMWDTAQQAIELASQGGGGQGYTINMTVNQLPGQSPAELANEIDRRLAFAR